MRRLKFIFFASIALSLALSSCSLQKRHYRNWFYIENSSSTTSNETKKTTKHSIQEKLYTDVVAHENSPPILIQSEEQVTLASKHETKQLTTSKPRTRNIKPKIIKHDIPDPKLNHVPKASFRMICFSILFLAAAFYVFSNLSGLFYVGLGLCFIAFLFAMIAMITSISAGKDRVANDKKGILIARITLILSFLVFAAIALFFIFTPIDI